MTQNVIDANIILRYLLNDPQAPKIEKLLKSNKQLILNDVITAEIVWVLDSFYKWDREKISKALIGLLSLASIKANKKLLGRTLDIFASKNIDFPDAYLVAFIEEQNLDGIYSFDHDFNKFPQIRRIQPK